MLSVIDLAVTMRCSGGVVERRVALMSMPALCDSSQAGGESVAESAWGLLHDHEVQTCYICPCIVLFLLLSETHPMFWSWWLTVVSDMSMHAAAAAAGSPLYIAGTSAGIAHT